MIGCCCCYYVCTYFIYILFVILHQTYTRKYINNTTKGDISGLLSSEFQKNKQNFLPETEIRCLQSLVNLSPVTSSE